MHMGRCLNEGAKLRNPSSLNVPADENVGAHCFPDFDLEPPDHGRGVLATAFGGMLVRWNRQAAILLGLEETLLDRSRAISDVFRAVRPLLSNPEALENLQDSLRQDGEATVEQVLLFRQGVQRDVHIFTTPLYGGEPDSWERVFVVSDITRRRQLEASVRRAFDELKNAQDLLIQSEKLRAIGQIAGGVAHDFNNILGIILGNIQLLKTAERDEKALAKLARAERAALDGIETVRRIQEFTRQRSTSASEVLNLSEMAQELVETMRPIYENQTSPSGSSIAVRVEAGEGAFAAGSSAEIRQVLTNIFLNAVQAMPDGGEITLRTGREGVSSWVSIADTGVGMSPEVRERVFEPFFTTRGVEGTGLGLSVAYGIVRRHDGSIVVESEPGKGTTVTVYLPYGRPSGSRVANDETECEETTRARILVVDDEAPFAQVMVEMLQELGHEAVAVYNGRSALDELGKNGFDVVFTDLGMPGMSGREVADAAKKLAPQARVVLLTGWDDDVVRRDVEDASVDLVLTKPLKMEQLPSIISDLLCVHRED